MTTIHDFGGVLGQRPLIWTLSLLGSHTFMVMALDLCMKCPLIIIPNPIHMGFYDNDLGEPAVSYK